ncbi:hypothetical protein O3M35_001395 [Rhynocoris fuscipes]|uniref:Rhythmically expressed gene 5 protein n=1 Tax=Rhynocoris fuscipes TaxID=488301 RepID=A0AAW1CUZ1_9HEMI
MCIVKSTLIFAVFVTSTLQSAIPMWEYLTRGEKMSHLFNMFVKQVSDHCHSSNMPDCEKVLLVYGLTNLAKMEDESLDKMDPYQRGANNIIWQSMMQGNYERNTEANTDNNSDFNESKSSDGSNHLEWQEEASTNIEKYSSTPSRYIVGGPMVVRVHPDGSPVAGDSDTPLPADEDAEEYLAMRSKPLPSISHITATSNQTYSQTYNT